MREEVCRVWNKEDKTAFDLGRTADVGEFEKQRCANTNDNTDE